MSECAHPDEKRAGVEYPYGHPGRYDGVSEWVCTACGQRKGRWSGRVLAGDDYERPFDVRQEPKP